MPGSIYASSWGVFLIQGLELKQRIFNKQASLIHGLFAAGTVAMALGTIAFTSYKNASNKRKRLAKEQQQGGAK